MIYACLVKGHWMDHRNPIWIVRNSNLLISSFRCTVKRASWVESKKKKKERKTSYEDTWNHLCATDDTRDTRNNSSVCGWNRQASARERQINHPTFQSIDSTQIIGINRTALWLLIATRAGFAPLQERRNTALQGFELGRRMSSKRLRNATCPSLLLLLSLSLSLSLSLFLPLLLRRDYTTIVQNNLNNHRLQGKRESLMAGNPFVKTVVTSSTNVARGKPRIDRFRLLMPLSVSSNDFIRHAW